MAEPEERGNKRKAGRKRRVMLWILGMAGSLLALSYDRDASGWVFKAAHIEMPEVLLAIVTGLLVLLVTNSHEILTDMRKVGAVADDAKQAAADARAIIAEIKQQTAKIVEGHNQQQAYPPGHYASMIAADVLAKLTHKYIFTFIPQEIKLTGEYLALEGYQKMFELILERLEDSRIAVHAVHSTSVHLWGTARGKKFLALQAKIAKKENGSVTRLIVGPVPFEELSEHDPSYTTTIRTMLACGIKLYYADHSSLAPTEINDFVLVEDGDLRLVFRWIPHPGGHNISDALIAWDNPTSWRTADIWTDQVERRIREGKIVRLKLEGDQITARKEPKRTMTIATDQPTV